jgi:hypothetical protein
MQLIPPLLLQNLTSKCIVHLNVLMRSPTDLPAKALL